MAPKISYSDLAHMIEFYFSRLESYKTWVKKGPNGLKVYACIMLFGFLLVFFSAYIPERIMATISVIGFIATVILLPFLIVTMISTKLH